jgi:hypothetical protein
MGNFSKLQKILCTILCLSFLLRSTPAKAEFATAWIAVGIVIGITMAEISHQNDECLTATKTENK